MTDLTENNTLILIIDIQEKLLNATFNKDKLAKKAEIISKVANILNIPTIVTEQYPQGLGETVKAVKINLPTCTSYYEKKAFNALEDINIKKQLEDSKIQNIIIFGIETHICVYQTIVNLLELGYNTTLICDCCGSRKEEEYFRALDIISKKGADIKTAEMFIFELLKTAKHPNFKEIQALIK